jgi:hypothetical protein
MTGKVRRGKPPLSSLMHAFDEAAFGSERTLNLRESLPSAAEARRRTEVWLRGRQMTRAEEVLVITGRGNQSAGGIGVIRQQILGMLPGLRRRGIVESWREHTPGSFVVKVAPVSALLSAPRRRRDTDTQRDRAPSGNTLTGLEPETLQLLRDLATQNLGSLGVEATEEFVLKEMTRTFSALIGALPAHAKQEENLCEVIRRAIEEGGGER